MPAASSDPASLPGFRLETAVRFIVATVETVAIKNRFFSFSRFLKTAKRKKGYFFQRGNPAPALSGVSEAKHRAGYPRRVEHSTDRLYSEDLMIGKVVEYDRDSGGDEAGERGRAGPHGRAARDGEGMTMRSESGLLVKPMIGEGRDARRPHRERTCS